MLGQVAVEQVVTAGKEYEQQGQEYWVDYHVADHRLKIRFVIVRVFEAEKYSVAYENEQNLNDECGDEQQQKVADAGVYRL